MVFHPCATDAQVVAITFVGTILTNMLYNDYLKRVAELFEESFKRICVHHNTEYGDEFEIALCTALRRVLPDRFGVCRGYAVTSDGREAGDDILIFNRESFGTLRLLEQDEFAQKERIPIETVCAYIEAKHTLSLVGDDGQSLGKALRQVAAVKALGRQRIPFNQMGNVALYPGDFSVSLRKGWPDHRNPLFTCIWSNGVRGKKGSEVITNSKRVVEGFEQTAQILEPAAIPDLVVLGQSAVCLPMHSQNGRVSYVSPFFIPNESLYSIRETSVASGVAICSILYALNHMQTSSLSWERMICDGVGGKVLEQ